jgi:hypothetical protein
MEKSDEEHANEPWEWADDEDGWRGLADSYDWPERYPGMPTVEEASRQTDPILWVRAWRDPGCVFYAAGYSPGEHDARRIYGLELERELRWMEWVEIDRRFLDWEGPGDYNFRVDESWSPVRASEVLRRDPGYRPIPEEERSIHPLHPFVTSSDFGTLKASLVGAVAIHTLAIVRGDFDADRDGHHLAAIRTPMGWLNLEERQAAAREMATQGRMSVAVRDLDSVPPEWRPCVVSFDEMPDGGPCEVIYIRGMYYVRPK